MITLYILIVLISVFVWYCKNKLKYSYWAERGIPHPKPFLVFGNIGASLAMTKSLGQIFREIYDEYPNDAVVGVYKCFEPTLLIRDPKVVRDVTVKYFNHFQDNDIHVDKEVDPIFGRNPFVLKGEEWKALRSILTPSFTAGKMKAIFPLMVNSAEKMIKHVQTHPDAKTGLDAKLLSGKYTMENVANCAFGLEGNCFTDPQSEFLRIGKLITTPNLWTSLKFLLLFVMPFLSKYIHSPIFPKEVQERIISIVNATLNYRRKKNVERNDYLQILANLKNTSDLTDFDVPSQAGGFMLDGYETSSGAMSFVLFELAQNQKIQEKLREEINKNETIAYDALLESNYLDAVLSETLRIHPPANFLTKTCTEDYTFTVDDSSDLNTYNLTVKKGSSISLPLHGLHMDPKYFPEPEKFDPNRFMPENKDNITNYTYLPLGVGPRFCLGQRFALLQVKVGVAYLVKNFRIKLSKKTKIPWEYDPTYFLLALKGGIWLTFEKI